MQASPIKDGVRKEIDTTTIVSAENVVIDTAGNSLTPTNLQAALDSEMAINLIKILPGTIWTISNVAVPFPTMPKTGRITFSKDTFSLNQGSFSVIGQYDYLNDA
jgi:hypothetical protein